VGLPPNGTVSVKVEPLSPARVIQGPAPQVPVPRIGEDQEGFVLEADWDWHPVEDEARDLPLASVTEEGFIRDWRVARLRLAPMSYLGADRWQLMPRFRVQVITEGVPEAAAKTAPEADTAPFAGLVEGMLLNGEQAVDWRSADPPVRPVTVYPLPETTWRIGITSDGIYRLTHEAMDAAKVPVAGAAPADFHLISQGREVALQEVGMKDGHFEPGDSFLFYGEKFHGTVQDEKYTDENVYWLVVDSSTRGLRMEPRSVAPSGAAQVVEWYTATVRAEENNVYWSRHSDNPGTDATWFWKKMTVAEPLEEPIEQRISLTDLASGAYGGMLRVEVAAGTYYPVDPDHNLELWVNDEFVSERSWDGKVGWLITLPLSSALLKEGNNIVGLIPRTEAGIQIIYLNWIEITYRRQTVAESDRLDFTAPFDGKAAYTLTGFTTEENLRLFDLSNAFAPRVLTGAVPKAAGLTWNLVFTASGTEGKPYLAVADAEIEDVPALTMHQPDLDLLSSTQSADEVMIVPGEFFAAIQPLANHRRAEGLRVRVVRVEDLYALFNDGIVHPEAIRRFLAYAYQHWEKPAPAYALLVGDGHYNPKGFNPDKYGDPTPVYIPPYLEFLDPWEGEVPVDTRFAQIVGDDTFPDLAMGRLPANSAQDVLDVVAKIIAYEKEDTPAWQDRVIFTADNVPDAAGDFEGVLDRLSTDYIPARFRQEKVYLTDFCGPPLPEPPWIPCPSANTALLDTWSEGAALLTYLGHGAVYRWTKEELLFNTDVAKLKPGHGLPFVISLNCLDGYWMFPSNLPWRYDLTSMAEWMVMGADHGSIANFSPAGLGTTPAEEIIARRIYSAMFYKGERRLGELALAGQLTPVGFEPHLPLVSTLFGDPGGRLKLEQAQRRFALLPGNSTVAGGVGEQTVQSFTLGNFGDLQDGAELSVVGNKWPTTLSQTEVANLGPGQSTAVQVTVDVPTSVSPGERDSAQLIVTSTSDPSVRASATLTTIAMGEARPVYLPLVIRNSGRP
jgi:hypothetical protein